MNDGATIELAERYATRAVVPLPLWRVEGWRVKTYGIVYRGAGPRPELVDAARAAAAQVLPRPAVAPGRYGVGFLGVHDGRDACFAYLDWWGNENELHHHPFLAPLEDPDALAPCADAGFAACVWDLALIAHERQAWVETVLDNPASPDLDAYLDRVLTGQV